MSEEIQFERLKDFDYTSLILQYDDAAAYPVDMDKNAYYGFYLLARSVGKLLAQAKKAETSDPYIAQESDNELALSYLESDCFLEKKNPFLRTAPYSYQLVDILKKYLIDQSNIKDADYTALVDQIQVLVRKIESSRVSGNYLRSLDIYLAKCWCRILRVFCFMNIPENFIPKNYSFSRDIHISSNRGISKQQLLIMHFRVRFQRMSQNEKPGKLILLAEEWERQCLNNKIDADPHEYELLVLDLLDTESQYKMGLEWLEMLVLRYPEYKYFHIWKARYLRRDGKNQEALKICQDLLQKYALDYEIHCLQSNLYFLDGHYKEAQRSALFATSCAEDKAEAHITLAYAYLYDDVFDDAVASFDAALALDPKIADAYRGKGKALIMEGEAYEAMECLIIGSRYFPKDAEIYHDLADVYFMCGYLDECKKYCHKCLAVDPHCAGAYVLLGMLEIRKNHENSAGKWLHRALELEPQNPIALNELAYVQHMNGNDEECIMLLEKAIEIAPDFPDVLCSMGVVYFYQSEFDEALDYFDRTLVLDDMHIGALVGKGNLYLAQSDADEALVWFDKALQFDPEFPEAIHGKVNAYRALGLEQDAFEWTQKASDLGIDSEDDE